MFRYCLSRLLFCLAGICFSQAQETTRVHSHNDYEQAVPFWAALAGGASSIEVDVFLKNDTLYATHGESEIKKGRTIESLYLDPLKKAMGLELQIPGELQLLVDIKSEVYTTLEKLVEVLKNYPGITGNSNVSIVISGNRPAVEHYNRYPDHILFDYQDLQHPGSDKAWDKVALISLDFRKFSLWNGLGRLTEGDFSKVKNTIDKAHNLGKPFRFWAAPDTKTAWKAFTDMGVDFINTDMPFRASAYLGTLEQRVYRNEITSEVYVPTYAPDKEGLPVKNIILLIGDGNGLSQISSAALANGGALTLTQFRNIGFLKTQAADDFTTDSAAGGTALATGKKTRNRAIGVDTSGMPVQNITELLSGYGFVSGIITTDRITGATPAAFYAHRKDRSEEKGIREDLVKSHLSLFIGGGKNDFRRSMEKSGFTMLNTISNIGKSRKNRIGLFLSDDGVPSVLEGRGNILAESVRNGLEFLASRGKPFFLMVEGAKIDSYGHANNTAGIVAEGIDFDRAITEAVKFADTTGNTLVIVTADHETSGFSIPQGSVGQQTIEGDFTTNDHTGVMVPVFAYGPRSQEFRGVYENNEVFEKILKVLEPENGEK